jgi:predicted GNAT family acetyltransferase
VWVDDDAAGAPLASAMRTRGWRVDHDVYMALRREPDRRGSVPAREAGIDELLAAKEAVTLEIAGPADWEIIRPATHEVAVATGARFFVADFDGSAASYCTLYSDGATAQVEDVATQQWARGHGLARAAVQAAVDAAVAGGHELVFLCADDDDWPKELYAKLGFEPVGYSWAFIRLPPAKSTASRM